MKDIIKVSVVIPTYKRPQFICRAIDSCYAQQGVTVEVIVVDDNGEGTECQMNVASIIEKYTVRDDFNYIIHKQNKNGSAARNTGIYASNGDYIAFLDDDDWFEDTKLVKQVQLMKREHSRACLTGFRRVYSNVDKEDIPNLYDAPFQFLSVIVDACGGSGLLIEKRLAVQLGGYQESFFRHQDVEFNYRISKETKISVVQEILVNVYMHPGNYNLSSNQRIIDAKLHYLDIFRNDISKYPKQVQSYIYDCQYIEIVKACLKDKKYIMAIQWIFKTSHPLKSMILIIRATLNYITKKEKVIL